MTAVNVLPTHSPATVANTQGLSTHSQHWLTTQKRRRHCNWMSTSQMCGNHWTRRLCQLNVVVDVQSAASSYKRSVRVTAQGITCRAPVTASSPVTATSSNSSITSLRYFVKIYFSILVVKKIHVSFVLLNQLIFTGIVYIFLLFYFICKKPQQNFSYWSRRRNLNSFRFVLGQLQKLLKFG